MADTVALAEWKATNKVYQQAGQNGCVMSNPKCTTITWGDEKLVPATCGTATLADDPSYSVIGCYPSSECLAGSGPVPDAEDARYLLTCGSLKLLVSAAVAAAIAYAM